MARFEQATAKSRLHAFSKRAADFAVSRATPKPSRYFIPRPLHAAALPFSQAS